MSPVAKILRGSGSNVVRLACTSVVAIALPLFLTRDLSRDAYSTWVALLQISTYVALLDLGLQTVVARFVAEHDARGEPHEAVRVVVSAVRILLVGAIVGATGVVLASWNVAALFPQMPVGLHDQARIALLLIGLSSAAALPFGPCLAAFTGLQRYGLPTALTIASKALQAVLVVSVAALGGDLVGMAAAFALVNVLTMAAQYLGWRRLVRARLTRDAIGARASTIRLLLSTGGLIALWSLGGLLVNGLDTVIVGHFDFRAVGAFAVATTAVNFLLMFLNSLFSPLMPAAAAMQGPDAPERVAALTLRATRYSTLLIVGLGSLLAVAAYPLLVLWVGPDYAATGAPLLRLLVLGQAIRQLAYVYSLAVIARGRQRPATIATMAEAVVNLTLSIALAGPLGAAGVAVGTIVGAAISVLLHLVVSMRFTRQAIPLTRRHLVWGGVALPALSAFPLILLLPSFDAGAVVPAAPWALAIGVGGLLVSVVLLGLGRQDRRRITTIAVALRSRAAGGASHAH